MADFIGLAPGFIGLNDIFNFTVFTVFDEIVLTVRPQINHVLTNITELHSILSCVFVFYFSIETVESFFEIRLYPEFESGLK